MGARVGCGIRDTSLVSESASTVTRSMETSPCEAWHIMAVTDEPIRLGENLYVAREDGRACRCARAKLVSSKGSRSDLSLLSHWR
jgi:hypothetical protein